MMQFSRIWEPGRTGVCGVTGKNPPYRRPIGYNPPRGPASGLDRQRGSWSRFHAPPGSRRPRGAGTTQRPAGDGTPRPFSGTSNREDFGEKPDPDHWAPSRTLKTSSLVSPPPRLIKVQGREECPFPGEAFTWGPIWGSIWASIREPVAARGTGALLSR